MIDRQFSYDDCVDDCADCPPEREQECGLSSFGKMSHTKNRVIEKLQFNICTLTINNERLTDERNILNEKLKVLEKAGVELECLKQHHQDMHHGGDITEWSSR